MSAYEPKHDQALLAVPWLAHPPWLLKYAPHPDRAGYVFLATNLEVVLFESLTAPSIPSRLQAIASSQSQSQRARGSASQRPEGDLVRQAEGVLGRLEGEVMVLGGGWEGVEVDVREHAFYDRVVEITANDFHWTFNMTELPPPHPLSVIRTHLLGPLVALMPGAEAHPSSLSTIELLSALLASKDFANSLIPPGKSPVDPSSNVHGRGRSRASPVEEDAEVEPDDAPAQTQELVPETLPRAAEEDGGGDGRAEDEEEEYRSPEPESSLSPPPRRSSRSRAMRAGQANDQAKGTSSSPGLYGSQRRENPPSNRSADVPNSPDSSPPTTRSTDKPKPSTDPQRTSSSPSPSHVPANPRLPSNKNRKPPSAVSARNSRSASPVKRAREIEPTPTQSSQKSKKEREKEEEEMMERRMEEMKRKMGSGAGGRLGRRRAGR